MVDGGRDDVTVLGRDARLEGDFAISGSIRIDGHFKGKIVAEGSVMLSDGSDVHADIEGENVAVGGSLRGDIVARGRAELGPAARFHGDIKANALSVALGAVFNGRSTMATQDARR